MEKFRTIITTDGEVDDINSFIRYLLYSNEMDTLGIILTSSKFHYAGTDEGDVKAYRWTGEEWINELIESYKEDYNNLVVHDDNYPTPEYLKSIYMIGNISAAGEMDENSEGAQLIESTIMEDNSSPLYIQMWGGTNTTARALKSIEEKYSNNEEWNEIKRNIEEKVTLYIIMDQDDTYQNYILKNWNLKIVHDQSNFCYFAYRWKKTPSEFHEYFSSKWNYDLTSNFGSLLSNYHLIGDGRIIEGEKYEELRGTQDYLDNNPSYKPFEFISEGDSLSYFYLLQNGLRNNENPRFGGWGGRFLEVDHNVYKNQALDWNPYTKRYEAEYSFIRWIKDIQQDFKARAAWSRTDNYSKVAHYPKFKVNQGLEIDVEVNELVKLDITLDNYLVDQVDIKFWHYFEVNDSTQRQLKYEYKGDLLVSIYADGSEKEVEAQKLEIHQINQSSAEIRIPKYAKVGDEYHIIAEVKTRGYENPMKIYERIILTVVS